MSIKKILIFTSLFFSIFFSVGLVKNNFNINNVNITTNSSNKIKLLKNGTTSKSVTIQAILSPSSSTGSVGWFVSWKNSTGNIGKANDYVTITSSSDTLTCTVKFVKAFTTPIKLQCTLIGDTSKTASATIDYVGRTINNHYETYDLFTSSEYDIWTMNMFDWRNFLTTYIDIESGLSTGGTLNGYVRYEFSRKFDFYFGNELVYNVDLNNGTDGYYTLLELVHAYIRLYYAPLYDVQNITTSNNVIGIKVNYSISYFDDYTAPIYVVENKSMIFWFDYPWDYWWC